MNDSPLWLSASLACLLTLVLLACAACLFLIRRINRLSRSEQRTEQRLIQLAVDFRGLEQRVREMKGHQREAGPAESPPALISIPDMTTRTPGATDDAANLAQKHAEVWAMAERGLAAAEIARTTRRPIGEVELILGLRGRHNTSKNAGDHANAT